MATGCDISLRLREGVGWHQRCRGEQAGEGSRAAAWGGGVLRCWGRVLHPAPFLVASSPVIPRASTAGDGDAVGMQSMTGHSGPQPATGSGLCLPSFELWVPPGTAVCIWDCGCAPLPLPGGFRDRALQSSPSALAPQQGARATMCGLSPQVPPPMTWWLGEQAPREAGLVAGGV